MTTRDLERRLTMAELVEWQTFEEEFGPLTLHQRIDHAAALIAHVTWAAAGQQAEFSDFLPNWHPEPVGNVVDLFTALAGKGG